MTSIQTCVLLAVAGVALMLVVGVGALFDTNGYPGRATVAMLIGAAGVLALVFRVLLGGPQ